jgi:phenylacetate-CoA ligase
MADVRQEWLDTIERHRSATGGPATGAAAGQELWAPRLDAASRDELRAIQDDKLRVAVRYAYERIPFYRRRFDRAGLDPRDIRTVDDLQRIPVATKQEMASDLAEHQPWGTYTAVGDQDWVERGWQIFASSGTTAQPRAFRYTAFDRELWAWSNARAMWAMGFRPRRDVALLAFGYGPHVWLWGVHYALNLMGIPVLTGGGLDSATRARFVDRYRPTILACTPSYALYLGGLMREMGLDPAESSVRYLFCAGEPGYSVPATRRRLEAMWRADLHEFYGCTEAAPAAGGYTCQAVVARKDGPVSTHLMEDAQIWEVVDPRTHEPVPEGRRGVSVVTNLVSEASPQLRFLVGDYTTLTTEPCACGRTHLRALGGFVGRADDMLNVRGVTLFPSSVEDAVRRVPSLGDEFAIELSSDRDLDVLTVRVEALAGTPASAHPEIAARVEQEIRAGCEVRPVVEVLEQGTLPRTEFKANRVKDLRGAR